jgi:hypothetical protein
MQHDDGPVRRGTCNVRWILGGFQIFRMPPAAGMCHVIANIQFLRQKQQTQVLLAKWRRRNFWSAMAGGDSTCSNQSEDGGSIKGKNKGGKNRRRRA